MQSEVLIWEGNTNVIVVEGDFPAAGGIRTHVTFSFQPKRGDGFDAGESLTFFEPTRKRFSLPPGSRYQFSAGGPEGLDWDVRWRIEPEPPKPPKEPTLAQRLAAAEQRIDEMTGLAATPSGRAN